MTTTALETTKLPFDKSPTFKSNIEDEDWIEIECPDFGKQYFHYNYTTFSVILKNGKRNILKTRNQGKYLTLSICINNNKYKSILYHRFVYHAYNIDRITCCDDCKENVCIFNVFKNKHQIDHIDGDHSNNHPENLQRLCISCHSTKTIKQTTNKRLNHGIKQSVKILAYKKGDIEYKKEYNSIKEASNELGITTSSIGKNLHNYEQSYNIIYTGSRKNTNKYRFEKVKEDEIEGEIWKDIQDLVGQVSNKGRIKNLRGIISYGNEDENSDYLSIKILNKIYRIHILIMKSFEYEKLVEKAYQIKNSYPECKDITIEDIINSNGKRYSIVVDHIDRNPKNNVLENLRWSTIKENAENTNRIKKVYQYTLDNVFIKTYISIAEASRQTKVNNSCISNACNNRIKTAGKFIWKFQ